MVASVHPPLSGKRQLLAASYARRFPHGLAPLVQAIRPALWQWCQIVGIDADEVSSAGFLGVCQAAQTWRPKGVRFAVYAFAYIERRVRDACRATDRYKARTRAGLVAVAVDEDELLAVPAPEVEDRTELHDDLAKLRLTTGNLPDQLWQVLVWRYGFAGRRQTLREIGDVLGVSKDTAYQLERKALIRCRW